jgi:hypothetical protein
MPGFIKPQLATLKSEAPVGQQWLHEIKFDGYRVQQHDGGERRYVTLTLRVHVTVKQRLYQRNSESIPHRRAKRRQ